MNALLRERLRALREERGLSQEQLASAMGLGDRQALSLIESGGRQISPQELERAASALGSTVFALSDPFQLIGGEGKFSWRQSGVTEADLSAFEARAGRWIAAFRHLSLLKGEPVNSAVRRIGLNDRSAFEDAWHAGEAMSQILELGEIPAKNLAQALQEQLDTLVLHVDATNGISGAACQLTALNAILVNRNEPEGRRNFDLAHEFFHLLTWEAMPPRHRDETTTTNDRYKRVEQLAENFAGALLMPSQTVNQIVNQNPIPREGDIAGWISHAASIMLVSPTALLWRLVCLRHLSNPVARQIAASGGLSDRNWQTSYQPPAFSSRLIAVIGWAIDTGHLSARRAASLVDTTVEGLRGFFEVHAVPCPYEL